jgi:hypothetical protein
VAHEPKESSTRKTIGQNESCLRADLMVKNYRVYVNTGYVQDAQNILHSGSLLKIAYLRLLIYSTWSGNEYCTIGLFVL